MVKPQSSVQELGDILKLLNPPLEKFAERVSDFLSTLPPKVSTELILATYFDLFAQGFTLWDISYDYHKVHEYYYGAYLRAKQLVDENSTSQHKMLLEMLEKLTLAMIAFTGCENAMMCNDPKGLFIAAIDAIKSMKEAQRLLGCSSLEKLLSLPIKKYCDLYLHNFRGLKICAEIFLAALSREEIPSSKHSSIKESLSILDSDSPEIASILQTHYIFAQRFLEAQTQRSSDLLVKEGKLLLRAIGYVGEEIVEAIFDEYKNKSSKKKLDELCTDVKRWGLPIESVYSLKMQDIFDTILGDENLHTIVFELPTNDSALSFLIRDAKEEIPYSVEKFQICLTHFGSISVEFGISLKEDTSVSHVRVLDSLISPDAGRFDFVWRDAPPLGAPLPDAPSLRQETINFVEYLLKSQKWIERIRPVTQGELCITLNEMDNVLKEWQMALRELAKFLPRGFAEYPDEYAEPNEEQEKAPRKNLQEYLPERRQKALRELANFLPHGFSEHPDEHAEPNEEKEKDIRKKLREYLQKMNELAQTWIKDPSTSHYSDLIEEGNRYFPAGFRFARLMDIAKEVLYRIEYYLRSVLKAHFTSSREKQTKPSDSFQRHLHFDPNIGWSTILSCNKLTVVGRDGRKREPTTKEEYHQVFEHDQFKGFIIQSREARASFYDWLFVVTPSYQNLATFRSHETDMMCITENRTFLYLSDEPAYLVKQYIETARLMDDIRILVFSFNDIAKEQIKHLELFLKRNEQSKLKKSKQKLLDHRDRIERYHTYAERILDLLRTCTISKYHDHSDLLKAMVNERRMNVISDALERNMANLDRFHGYISEQLNSRISDHAANNQKQLNQLIFILTIVSTVSAISGSFAFFQYALGSIIAKGTLLLLIVVFLGSLIISLIVWLKDREK